MLLSTTFIEMSTNNLSFTAISMFPLSDVHFLFQNTLSEEMAYIQLPSYTVH